MCHYRRHLKGSLLSVYEYAVAVAKPPDKIFCASIATTCDATGYHHKTVSVALRRLTERGWLVKEDRNRLLAKTGTFQPNWYQVIDHDQRAVDHPEECRPTDRGIVLPPRQNTATVKPSPTVVTKPSMTVVTKPTHIVRKNSKKEQREYLCSIEPIERLWDFFVEATHRRRGKTLTPLCRDLGEARLQEAVTMCGGDVTKATQVMRLAIEAMQEGGNYWEIAFSSPAVFQRWLNCAVSPADLAGILGARTIDQPSPEGSQ